jgi:uncharacterized protein
MLAYISGVHMDDYQEALARLSEWNLHRAAQAGDLAAVNHLLEGLDDIDRFDDIGLTALHYAVMENRAEVVSILLKAGANVNAHDPSVIGNTPLVHCAGNCTYEIASLLIEAGANPNIRGWMSLNAIDRASERSDVDAPRIRSLLNKATMRFGSPPEHLPK